MKAHKIVPFALIGLVLIGCARQDRWVPGQSRTASRTDVAPSAQLSTAPKSNLAPAMTYREVSVNQSATGYSVRNTSNQNIRVTLLRTPSQRPASNDDGAVGERDVQVLVPAGSEVPLGPDAYRIIFAEYR